MKVIDKGRNYKVYCLRTGGKVYIGYTGENTVKQRIDKGYNHNKPLAESINTHGCETWVIFRGVSKRWAENAEKGCISAFDSTNPQKGWNRATGGKGGHTGCKWTQEQREQAKLAALGRKLDRIFERFEKTFGLR